MICNLYTDGACQPNPGAGGWAFIIDYDSISHAQKGGKEDTTNNRMELTAVLEGLKFFISYIYNIDQPILRICSDSKYLLLGMEQWLENWEKNNWRRTDKKPVLNTDLWKEINELKRQVQIEYKYIKGHSGHPENEKCDQLAVSMIKMR